MKLSIAELLSIPAFSALVPAFADVTGEEYRNPDFQPGQEVANKVADYLDARHAEITPIGKETPIFTVQTTESYMSECNASYRACEAAKDVFRLLHLEIPQSWSNVEVTGLRGFSRRSG